MSSAAPADAPISRQDVQASLACYGDLLKATNKYHRKFLEMAQVAAEFAGALDAMAKSKGAEQSGTGLKTAAELHRNIAKHQEQLAESFHKDFEVPLQRNLITHTKRVEENEKNLEKATRKMQDEISKTESKMLKGRKKDLSAFQVSLQDMQRQAQELEKIKSDSSERTLDDEQKNLMFLVQKAAGIVKSEYDHYSSLGSLTRESTEDIISIAFAPPGKILNAAEKRHVVDKFLGTTGGSSRDSVHSQEITAGQESFRRDSSVSSGFGVSAGQQKPRVNSSAQRPATPPNTPLPTTGSQQQQQSSSAMQPQTASRVPASSNAIQDSLKRLHIAASNVSSGGAQVSPTSGTASRTMSFTSQKSVHSQGAAAAAHAAAMAAAQGNNNGGEEDTASQNSLSSALAAIQLQRASMSVSKNTSLAADGGSIQPPQPPAASNFDLVVAIHDFTARTERELSFAKNDIMLVKQRQENWLYAAHYPTSATSKSGWIPVSYTAKQPGSE